MKTHIFYCVSKGKNLKFFIFGFVVYAKNIRHIFTKQYTVYVGPTCIVEITLMVIVDFFQETVKNSSMNFLSRGTADI